MNTPLFRVICLIIFLTTLLSSTSPLFALDDLDSVYASVTRSKKEVGEMDDTTHAFGFASRDTLFFRWTILIKSPAFREYTQNLGRPFNGGPSEILIPIAKLDEMKAIFTKFEHWTDTAKAEKMENIQKPLGTIGTTEFLFKTPFYLVTPNGTFDASSCRIFLSLSEQFRAMQDEAEAKTAKFKSDQQKAATLLK